MAWRPALDAGAPPQGLPPFATEEHRGGGGARLVRELPVLVLIALAIAFLLKSLVAQAFYIPSGSMVPQLQVRDRVVVSKISYRLHEPRRGDIVVFDAPPQVAIARPRPSPNPVVRVVRSVAEAVGVVQPSAQEFIKRVIALPGETVEGRAGNVYVDGRLLEEPYLPAGAATSDFPPVRVGDGQLWVMGDNRPNSSDSRVFGPIERDTVVGRAVVTVWPPGRAAFL
jgi:signal peptidase I